MGTWCVLQPVTLGDPGTPEELPYLYVASEGSMHPEDK